MNNPSDSIDSRFLAFLLINWETLQPRGIHIEGFSGTDNLELISTTMQRLDPVQFAECTITVANNWMRYNGVPILKQRFPSFVEDIPSIRERADFETWAENLIRTYGKTVPLSGF